MATITSECGLVSSSGQFDNLDYAGSWYLSNGEACGSFMVVVHMAIVYTCDHKYRQYEIFKGVNNAADFWDAHTIVCLCVCCDTHLSNIKTILAEKMQYFHMEQLSVVSRPSIVHIYLTFVLLQHPFATQLDDGIYT